MTSYLQGLIDRALAAAPADETVTHALSRDVALAGGAGTMALITLDNGLDHTKPNTFGARGLAELNASLDTALARPDVVAIGITGKPFILAAGADLTAAGGITDREQALTTARIGHGVFGKLGHGGKTSFCFVNGAALGGGVELALHCDYRTVLDSVRAIALPEVSLGLVPGWGGSYLLPNLVGPARALRVIVENPLEQNRMLDAPGALELGIADAMFGGADFLERSLAWAAGVLRGDIVVRRERVDRGPGWEAVVAGGRAAVDERLHGAAPAPYRALDLLAAARTADRRTAFAAEDETLADLLVSPQLRAGLYSFDLVQRRARRPAGAPKSYLAREVTKVGVVGAGLMAAQLATLFARRLEVPVVLTDLDQARVDAGLSRVAAEIESLGAHGRFGPGRLGADRANRYLALLGGTTDLAAFADCDLVIEAVFEDPDVKRRVFADLEQVVGPECLLATHTSALSVGAMAVGLAHPERVVGLHFFNPVAVLPLLEVVRAEQTDDPTLATAFAVAKTLRKSAVLVKDAPGFVVNRLLSRFLGVVTAAVDDGTDPAEADHALDGLGLPMTPFTLLQLVGPAVALHVAQTMHDAYGDRFHVSESLRALVDAGRPGLWSWDGSGRPYVDSETAALLTVGDSPWSAEQVRDRALAGLADEVGRMLAEKVVAEAADIDLCMILGAGWPFHLGGITPYLARLGLLGRTG